MIVAGVTIGAVIDVPPQGGGAALLNGSHRFVMTGQHPLTILLAISRAMLPEDLRQVYPGNSAISCSMISLATASALRVKCVYNMVLVREACPNQVWMRRMLTPFSSKWVA